MVQIAHIIDLIENFNTVKIFCAFSQSLKFDDDLIFLMDLPFAIVVLVNRFSKLNLQKLELVRFLFFFSSLLRLAVYLRCKVVKKSPRSVGFTIYTKRYDRYLPSKYCL